MNRLTKYIPYDVYKHTSMLLKKNDTVYAHTQTHL